MKRQGFTLWEIIGVFALVAIGVAIAFPLLTPSRQPARNPSCQNNLKQIGIALIQYYQDHDEHYPLLVVSPSSNVLSAKAGTRTHNYGWSDGLWAYTKRQSLFQCWEEPQNLSQTWPFKPTDRGFTDYWLNSNLNGKFLRPILGDASILIAIGDGNDGGDLTDARYNLPALPAAWISDKKSPAYRHKGMAIYAFLDGHVKALVPDQITNEPLANGKPTFAVR